MNKASILGIKVDKVSMDQAVDQIVQWTREKGKHYVVTPNVEMIMAAQKDGEFKEILNGADLAIPDSARIGWAQDILAEKNLFLKILKWPLFLLPKNPLLTQFDTVAGTDLMERLLKEGGDWAVTVGFLGGEKKLAEKLRERLKKLYPKLQVTFLSDGGLINMDGESAEDGIKETKEINGTKVNSLNHFNSLNNLKNLQIPSTDILFVGFGHIKQEKWISKNKAKYPVKVMIGVGGALDYFAGIAPRAPKSVRRLGFEWLYRLIVQPWRIKRFGALIKFVFAVLTN